MLGIQPDLLRRGGRRAPRRARLRDERQDHHHPPARRSAARRRAPTVVTNHTGANMPAGIAAALGRDRDRRRRDHRGRRTLAAQGGRPARRPSCSCSATSPATSSTASARCARSPSQWREVCTTHPQLRRDRERVRPARGLGRGAGEPHLDRARRAVAQRRRDLPAVRGAARLVRADRFDCPSCGFAQPETPHRLDGDVLVLDGERIPLHLRPARAPGTG